MTRRLAALAALAALGLAACGKYGPPRRSEPQAAAPTAPSQAQPQAAPPGAELSRPPQGAARSEPGASEGQEEE